MSVRAGITIIRYSPGRAMTRSYRCSPPPKILSSSAWDRVADGHSSVAHYSRCRGPRLIVRSSTRLCRGPPKRRPHSKILSTWFSTTWITARRTAGPCCSLMRAGSPSLSRPRVAMALRSWAFRRGGTRRSPSRTWRYAAIWPDAKSARCLSSRQCSNSCSTRPTIRVSVGWRSAPTHSMSGLPSMVRSRARLV